MGGCDRYEPPIQLSLALQMDGMRLAAINDFNGRNIPLVVITLGATQLHVSGSTDELVRMHTHAHAPPAYTRVHTSR